MFSILYCQGKMYAGEFITCATLIETKITLTSMWGKCDKTAMDFEMQILITSIWNSNI